jgi:hypothetical protein
MALLPFVSDDPISYSTTMLLFKTKLNELIAFYNDLNAAISEYVYTFLANDTNFLTTVSTYIAEHPDELRGLQGIQGEQGIQGVPGAPGADGADGQQGIQGTQGVKGDTGDQGIQGIQGVPGVDAVALSAYPVGAIYQSTVSTSPATLFGGTWAALSDSFLLAKGTTFATAGATGGSKDSVVVAHTHSLGERYYDDNNARAAGLPQSSGDATVRMSSTTAVQSTGVSGTNANLPPYLVVYMWERTA